MAVSLRELVIFITFYRSLERGTLVFKVLALI